jgi:hypothetical protein
LKRKRTNILTVAEAYAKNVDCCQVKSMAAMPRKKFKEPAVETIKEQFNVGLRKDLRISGKWTQGGVTSG